MQSFLDMLPAGYREAFGISESDVGLDSLDGMNLVLEVETILGINLGEFDLKGAGTINDFYTKAKEAVSKQG